jgi:5'-nucleotidase
MLRLNCDIDDVLLPLVPAWLKKYNRKYKDNLKVEQILDWNIDRFVKGECGSKIYEFIENPKIYNKIKPMPYALEGIDAFRELGFEIIYCTHSTVGAAGRKFIWLKDNGFWKEGDHYVETKSKHIIRADVLIDDNFSHIEKFQGRMPLLFDMPWNRQYNIPNRMSGWKEIIGTINFYKAYANEKNNSN